MTEDNFDHASPFGRSSGQPRSSAGQSRGEDGTYGSVNGTPVCADGDKVVDQFKGRAKSKGGGGKVNHIDNDPADHYGRDDGDSDDNGWL